MSEQGSVIIFTITAAKELGECLWLGWLLVLLSTTSLSGISFTFLHVRHIVAITDVRVDEGRVLLNVPVNNLLPLAIRQAILGHATVHAWHCV